MCATRRKIEAIRKRLAWQFTERGETWVPERQRILGSPALIPGEALSSWVARISANSRIPVNRVLGMWGATAPSFWLDCGAGPIDFDRVAASTMTPVSALAGFKSLATSILANPAFACLTIEVLHRRPIYRYCPECFRSDPVPYFRNSWRFASCYLCFHHREVMLDACGKCGRRIDLSRFDPKRSGSRPERALAVCNGCGHDLGTEEIRDRPFHLNVEVLARQLEIESRILATTAISRGISNRGAQGGPQNNNFGRTLNPRSGAEVLSLLDDVLCSYAPGWKSVDAGREHAIEIEKYLYRIDYENSSRDTRSLAIGIDGHAAFGDLALEIGSYLMDSQSLVGGTIWWPRNTQLQIDGINRFDSKAFAAAFRWIERFGSSHSTYPAIAPSGVTKITGTKARSAAKPSTKS